MMLKLLSKWKATQDKVINEFFMRKNSNEQLNWFTMSYKMMMKTSKMEGRTESRCSRWLKINDYISLVLDSRKKMFSMHQQSFQQKFMEMSKRYLNSLDLMHRSLKWNANPAKLCKVYASGMCVKRTICKIIKHPTTSADSFIS